MKDATNYTNSHLKKNSDTNGRKNILLLTSSLLVDRIFLYTNLIETLAEKCDVTVWATSVKNEDYGSMWNSSIKAKVEVFPEIQPFKQFPYNYLRRLNEFVWDFRQQIPSRMSMMRHVRDKNQHIRVRSLKIPARVLALFKIENFLENEIEKLLLSYPRSTEAEERLRELNPAAILTTGPFQFEQPAIFAAAKKLGIPTLAYIPSWDNVTTKNRLVFKYDGYIVWSEQTKKELLKFYPATENVPIYTVGAPQFDVFFQSRFVQKREDFFSEQNLNPELPLIIYALGSPNFLQEHHGAVQLAERISRGELGRVQMLVRPHPIHDKGELKSLFDKFAPHVRLQETVNAGKTLTERSQDEKQISEWVNTFRHADTVVNLSSTVTIDAAIFDKPVVNLDFDPQPGAKDQELIKDVNHKWNHIKPIAESGGVWLVENFDEMTHAVKTYLKNPTLHQAKRKWIARYVCGFLDGRCGERMADSISKFAGLDNDKGETTEKLAVKKKAFSLV